MGTRRILSPRAGAAVLVGILLFTLVVARVTGHWYTNLTPHDCATLVPTLETIQH